MQKSASCALMSEAVISFFSRRRNNLPPSRNRSRNIFAKGKSPPRSRWGCFVGAVSSFSAAAHTTLSVRVFHVVRLGDGISRCSFVCCNVGLFPRSNVPVLISPAMISSWREKPLFAQFRHSLLSRIFVPRDGASFRAVAIRKRMILGTNS